MKFITVYEATGPQDTTEGRWGGEMSYGFYFSQEVAKRVVSDKGVMGTAGTVRAITGYIGEINGKPKFVREIDFHDVLVGTREDDIIEKAKAKLTTEELKALGLK
jgi:hypothetical protein